MEEVMAIIIDDELLKRCEILSKLQIADEDRPVIKEDLEKMLNYFEGLSVLDTSSVTDKEDIFPFSNVFREDEITNQDNSENLLKNAVSYEGLAIKVPRSID